MANPRQDQRPTLDQADPQFLPDLIPGTNPAPSAWKKIYLVVLGSSLVFVGLIGCILPLLPGFPFLVLGLGMFGACSKRIASLVNAAERRLPFKLRLRLRPKIFRAKHRAQEQASLDALVSDAHSRGKHSDPTD